MPAEKQPISIRPGNQPSFDPYSNQILPPPPSPTGKTQNPTTHSDRTNHADLLPLPAKTVVVLQIFMLVHQAMKFQKMKNRPMHSYEKESE
ncbi:hypothetical protein D8674_035338 [Pyrus ussuriensis x Pyrus communis]|uniref:Uncharacterized protein n=1 Tax=Pyrus ussuriensis x Pyrus communis TaxID=2448454 RepID=A0A5N5GHK2_9ROSA|nr:hypothetical protein D8674_035338 [Pyrus ussuriensis x Pyrus communis]